MQDSTGPVESPIADDMAPPTTWEPAVMAAPETNMAAVDMAEVTI